MGLGWLSLCILVLPKLIKSAEICSPANGEDSTNQTSEDGKYEYDGGCRDGVFHGEGILKYSDGGHYDGEFRKGMRHGNGTMFYPESNKDRMLMYVGEWGNDKESGYGRLEYQEKNPSDQISTEGEFRNGLPNGNVTVFWQNGDSYFGETKDDIKIGFGTYNFSNGNVYSGELKSDNFNGNGTFAWAEGGTYEGEYKDGLQHGMGKMIYSDGAIYIGDWVEGNIQGNGTLTWPDGSSYQGQFKNGNRHGYGTYKYSNGNIYIGDWISNKRTGNGTSTWPDGDSYQGQFKNGYRHGYGTYKYSNGNVYIGEFFEGIQQGNGNMTYPDETKFIGEWYQNEKKNGKSYNKYGKYVYNYWIEKDEPTVELFDSFWDVPDSDINNETVCKKIDKKILEKSVKTPWYIRSEDDRDMQVWEAWGLNYTGRGVVVAVVDDGLARCHPALAGNYDQKASYDFTDLDNDPSPGGPSDWQGTKGAGIIAAKRDEPVCTIGIAYGAHLGGIRMLQGEITDKKEAHSLGFKRDHIDLYQISWGPNDDGKTFDGPGLLTRQTLKDGIKKGREGAGSIYVIASGTGGTKEDECNADGYVSSIFTIAVSSITSFNRRPGYSEKCSAILAATYSGERRLGTGLKTTGALSECDLHDGTAASASIASGIIALVLEANPSLSWRDIQHIIVQAAKSEDLLRSDTWVTNGAGFRASRSFGFGLMDAKKMVQLAANWTKVPEQTSCRLVTSSLPQFVQKFSEGNTVFEANCPDLKKLEHVQLEVKINSKGVRGLFSISLTSPAGTKVKMIGKRVRDGSVTGFHTQHWPLMTTHFWGESTNGEWTATLNNGNFEEAEIKDYNIILNGVGTN